MPPSDEILFERRGPLAIVQLNRPMALNAQNLGMVSAFAAQLTAWEADASVTRLFIHGAGGKAFCAGGDVRALWAAPPSVPDTRRLDFFTAEYALCAALRATRLETIAYLDGVTMGGGVGLSIYARHRLATPKTVWAMPEAAIGFYTDICATHFLPRLTVHGTLSPALGRLLGLTGYRLAGADTVGIVADRFVAADCAAVLIDALADASSVAAALDDCVVPSPHSSIPTLAQELEPAADLPLPQFLDRLVARGLVAPDYTRVLCALSLCAIDRALQLGAHQSYEETLAMDGRVVRQFLAGETFYEGVRARLIDRDNAPAWSGQRIEDVEPAAITAIFDNPSP